MPKLAGLLALFAAGLLLAGGMTAGVGAADVTTTETLAVTTTIEETTTAPASTVLTTEEQTTTVTPTSSPTTTTASSSSSSSTPTWIWIVLGILAAAVIGLLVALFTRRGGISDEERQRRLDGAVASWATQGWAVESQTPGSTILRRGPELMVVSIDDHGQISTRPVANS